MSKHQSFAPIDLEEHRQKRSVKKAKPWVVWYKLKPPSHLPARFRRWSRFGRYVSREIAEQAAQNDSRKHFWDCEYLIRHDSEGKPE